MRDTNPSNHSTRSHERNLDCNSQQDNCRCTPCHGLHLWRTHVTASWARAGSLTRRSSFLCHSWALSESQLSGSSGGLHMSASPQVRRTSWSHTLAPISSHALQLWAQQILPQALNHALCIRTSALPHTLSHALKSCLASDPEQCPCINNSAWRPSLNSPLASETRFALHSEKCFDLMPCTILDIVLRAIVAFSSPTCSFYHDQ